MTDDQGYPPLGCHGHPFLKTPNLDAFKSDAVSFEDFHSGTTCAPTRAGLFTGHYANSTGVWHTVGGRSLLRADEWTLANALADSGFRTGIFGKWHLGDEYPYRPQDRGFQRTVVHGGGGLGQVPDHWGNDGFDDTFVTDGVPTKYKGYCTDVLFNEAMDFIQTTLEQRKPVFCCITTNAPHFPYNVSPELLALYKDRTRTENYARFLAMITNIDDNFGRLRRKIAQLGIEDNTILIFASDNGQCGLAAGPEGNAFNSGMRGFKGSMYEGGHRIPMMFRWPAGGIRGGRQVHDLSIYTDFMPTILDLCGVTLPPERTFHGQSLATLLQSKPSTTDFDARILVTDTQRVPRPVKWRQSCVMQNKWRLINRDELYELSTDPSQSTDVASNHPELVAILREAYEAWWTLCERQTDSDIPISIGSPLSHVALLTTHDLRNDEGDGVWHQGQVRRGLKSSGYWEIKVETSGLYEIELKRWPVEAGHSVRAAIKGGDVEFNREAVAKTDWWWFEGGKALDIRAARVEVEGYESVRTEVKDGDPGAVLRLELAAGNRRMRACFEGEGGLDQAAYYVYVKLVRATETEAAANL